MLTVKEFKQSLRRGSSTCAGWHTIMPLIAWSLLIFILSAVPGDNYPQVSWNLADKVVHFSLYLVLAACAVLCFRLRGFGWWVPVAYGLLFGLSDELHQVWVPLRSPSISDWYADAAGVLTAVTALWLLSSYFNTDYTTTATSVSDSAESMELT